MKLVSDILTLRAPIGGLALVGIFWGGFAALMPDIKAIAGASDGQFGLIMMLSAAGSMIAMFMAPRLYQRAGPRTLTLVGAVLCVALLLPIWAINLMALSVVVFVMGASVGMMDITSNIRVSSIESHQGKSLMNLSHAMFSFSFGLTAIFVAYMREGGHGPVQILPILAGVGVVLVLLTLEAPGKWQSPDPTPEGANATLSGVHLTVSLLAAVVLFSSFVGENATEAWSALHIERTLGAEVGHGSFGPAVLGLVMGATRFLGHLIGDRIGERPLIIGSAVLGVIGALVIAAAWSPEIVLWGVAVVAVGMAVIVPSANTVLGRRVPGHLRPLALSRAWMFGMTGFFVGPSVMGLVAEGFGLRVAYVVIALIIAATIPAVVAIGRIPRVEGG